MLHTSYIELSKGALNHNVEYIKKRIGKNVRYSMVVKANAYGHGIRELIPMINGCGVDHFAVFSVAEAMTAYKVKSDKCGLMIMGFIDDEHLNWAIEHDVSFFVFTMERLKKVALVAGNASKKARIHIELETGMHRTGFNSEQLDEVVKLVKNNSKNIHVEGICSHLAGAENIVNYQRINDQIATFNELCSWLYDKGIDAEYRHLACSAGVLNYPESLMDMVRVGILNYGFWPSGETMMTHMKNGDFIEDPLKRVLSWKSKIMSVNKVDEGKYVSYGRSYLTNRKSLIATVPVGYGYGYNRTLSNNGHVLVHGKRVPVVGTVNMNMMVVDVTDLPKVKVGDEVVLIGNQQEADISVSSFSDMNNSMNYELLTRLPVHIPRKIVD